MMKISLMIALGLVVFGQSCENRNQPSESYEFPENRQWQKSEPISFSFTIEEEGNFNGILTASYVYGSQFSALPLTLTVSKEDVLEKHKITFQIKNDKGEELGDCTGDICDGKQQVFSKKHFDPGTYTFTLEHVFKYPYFPNIIRIGIDLDRVK